MTDGSYRFSIHGPTRKWQRRHAIFLFRLVGWSLRGVRVKQVSEWFVDLENKK